MPTEELQKLLDEYVMGNISATHRQRLRDLLQDPAMVAQAELILQQDLETGRFDAEYLAPVHSRLHQHLDALMKNSSGAATPVGRIYFLPKRMWAAAAAVFLLITGAAYFWVQHGEKKTSIVAPISVSLAHDILPGKQGAILKLSDGRQVVLDSMGNGLIAKQNGARIMLKGGQVMYDPTGKIAGTTVYNTMSTPRGRQFQLILPDGSRVWLNATSSITYPTGFTGTRREVSITGEAYFEVAHLSSKDGARVPFIVNINNQTSVEVLGTHFDVSSYKDEGTINTTLLEGLVKVIKGPEAVMLSPGQQAQVNNMLSGGAAGKIKVLKNTDIDKVMAWRNGLFNFDGVRLEEVMKQLSRWYDIEVVYEKGVPNIEFVGKMSKNVNLSDLLNGLKGIGVHFRIENGRRLVVLP